MAEKISDAEFEVLDALWESAPAAASDIFDRLKRRKDWSAQTVKTLIARLVEKGAVAYEPDGRRYLYRPTLSKDAYARDAAKSFVARLFDGRAAPLVANLADSGTLTKDDIAELEAILKEIKRERR
ncbi:MAG: BlaI/MecI/CopY family transcriptional regulator [Pseudomonadota bacterium]